MKGQISELTFEVKLDIVYDKKDPRFQTLWKQYRGPELDGFQPMQRNFIFQLAKEFLDDPASYRQDHPVKISFKTNGLSLTKSDNGWIDSQGFDQEEHLKRFNAMKEKIEQKKKEYIVRRREVYLKQLNLHK